MGEPRGFVVKLVGPRDRTAGVGVLVGPRRALTCAHVVNAALGRGTRDQERPAGEVTLELPLLEGRPRRTARVSRWRPPSPGVPGDDLALLELTEVAPAGAAAARLDHATPEPGRTVDVFGYPGSPPRPDGGWARAIVGREVGNGRLQLEAAPGSALVIQPGYSGSPLVDRETERVLGLVSAAPQPGTGARDSYAIPVRRLTQAWPDLGDDGVRARHRKPDTRRRVPSRRWRAVTTAVAGTVAVVIGGTLLAWDEDANGEDPPRTPSSSPSSSAAPSSAAPSPTPTPTPSRPSSVVFSDDFNRATLGEAKWGLPSRPEVVFVRDGRLNFKVDALGDGNEVTATVTPNVSGPFTTLTFNAALPSVTKSGDGSVYLEVRQASGRVTWIGFGADRTPAVESLFCFQKECSEYDDFDQQGYIRFAKGPSVQITLKPKGKQLECWVGGTSAGVGPPDGSPMTRLRFRAYGSDEAWHTTVDDLVIT
jgi:hypothetical protein